MLSELWKWFSSPTSVVDATAVTCTMRISTQRLGLTWLVSAACFASSQAFTLQRPLVYKLRLQNSFQSASSIDDNSCNIRPSQTLLASSSSSSHDNDSLPPVPSEWQGQVLQQLKSIIDPDLGTDIVTLGFVQNLQLDELDRTVSFNVELTTPACPVKQQFQDDCVRLVESLEWIQTANVTMTAQASFQQTEASGMAQIGAIVAVSSCKGGVGKSTTAVNLAFSLQALGANVGILDADVYGPSLPTMVTPDDDIVRFVGRQIAPLQRNGVRLMSFGYVNEGSAVMRGPMVTQLLDQFLAVTNWGSLDYLILDMPPGTGDIQLTLTQRLNITAAVIVTTPQELSFVDVVRGVEMFDSVNVPAVAVVENMAYYESPAPRVNRDELKQALAAKLQTYGLELNGGSTVDRLSEELVDVVQETVKNGEREQVRIFGAGHSERLSKEYGIEHTFAVPLVDQIAYNGDHGVPFVLEYPDSSQAKVYKDLAQAIVGEVAKVKFAGSQRPTVDFDKEGNLLTVDDETMTPATLRRGCRCAACVEEMTGRQILNPSTIPESIKPLNMRPTGNYALSVDWSDGHRSLYPYRQIRSMLETKEVARDKISL
ncbi:hypothetical protein MPSEU_000134400 [Mayamaea pseudoterrestris]|nr:hypothetical protein MPSEU_000134400 [Mayamaea pseudoterrestris]